MRHHTTRSAKPGFSSVHGGNEVKVLNKGIVRDARHAMFNPVMRGKLNPYYGLLPMGVVGALGAATGHNEDDLP